MPVEEPSTASVAHLRAIERRKRNGAVMRAHAPRRPELGPRRRHDEQGRKRPAVGDAAKDIERGRIGPVQILERQHYRLNLGRHCSGAATGRAVSLIHPAVSAFPDNPVGSACALSFSRFARRSLALRPAHSRCHRIS